MKYLKIILNHIIYIYIEYAISTKKSYFVKFILNLIIQKYYTNLKYFFFNFLNIIQILQYYRIFTFFLMLFLALPFISHAIFVKIIVFGKYKYFSNKWKKNVIKALY